MTKPELSELSIEISASDASQEDIDQMTRQLLSEVREMDVESAELTAGETAPVGTKAVDPVQIGSLAVTVLPALLPKLIEAVQAWAMRGSNRTVKFKGKIGGQVIDFEGPGEDWQALLARLVKRGASS